MATHSSTLAWRIPWTEEPGRLPSMGLLRVGHDWATSLTLHFHALEKEMATHSSVLAWRIPGTEEPGGLPSMRSHRVGHDWSDLAAAAAAAGHCRPALRTKDWANTRGELAGCGPAHPPPEAGRQAGGSQSRKGAISAPEMASSIKLWESSQLLTKTWDPGRLTCAGRVAARDQLPRRDTQHTWEGVRTAHPENQAAGMGEVIKCTPHLKRLRLPSTWLPELLRHGKGTKHSPTESAPLWSTQEPEPEWLRPGKCTQPKVHLRKFPCRATWRLSSVDWESIHAISGANPVWPRHCEHSPHTLVIFVCSVPPSPQHTWTNEPK